MPTLLWLIKKVGVFHYMFLLFHLNSCFQANPRYLRTYRSCCQQCWCCDNEPQFVGTNFGYRFGEFLCIAFPSISIDNTLHFLLFYFLNYWNWILAQHLSIYRMTKDFVFRELSYTDVFLQLDTWPNSLETQVDISSTYHLLQVFISYFLSEIICKEETDKIYCTRWA